MPFGGKNKSDKRQQSYKTKKIKELIFEHCKRQEFLTLSDKLKFAADMNQLF